MNIGKSIKIGLAIKDCNQIQAAKAVGVSEVTMCNWKVGKILPSLVKVQALAEFFGVPVSTFVEWGEK